MNTQKPSKLNQLLCDWPRGTVGTQPWLTSQGVSRFLAQSYCRGGWLVRIGQGAYQLAHDQVDWTGAVHALQQQLAFKVHVGAQTALELQGYRQYVPQGQGQPVWLLKSANEKRQLPKWFPKCFVKQFNIHCMTRSLFDDQRIGLEEVTVKDCKLIVSIPERAVLEYINLVPKLFSFGQAQFLLESMMTLRPSLLQSLLERCTSVKTKRLFLLLAEHAGHPWWNSLDMNKINLGKGKLVVAGGGYYYPKYQLSLPLKLENNDDNNESLL